MTADKMMDDQVCHTLDAQFPNGEPEELLPIPAPIEGATNKSRWPSRRLLNTLCLDFAWVTMGMSMVINGATLVDFSERLHETYGKLGIGLSVRNVGFFLGAVSGGVLRDRIRLHDNLIMASTSIITAVAAAIKPWSGHLIIYTVILVVEAFIIACMNIPANAILMSMWKEKSPSPVQSFHFSFGFGALLAPILAKPFLSVRCPQVPLEDNSTLGMRNISQRIVSDESVGSAYKCVNKTPGSEITYLRESRIEIPFTIISILFFIIAVLFLALYFSSENRTVIRPRLKSPNSETVVKTTTTRAQYRRFRVIIVFLTACFYFGNCSGESTVSSYLFTIAYESGLGFTKAEAADVFTAFYASFTGARFLGIFLLRRISIHYMFIFVVLGAFCAIGGQTFGGLSSKVLYWIFSCLLGVFIGPLWPSGYSWSDRYVTVSASVVAMFDTGAIAGGAIAAVLCGYLIEQRKYFYVFLYIFVIWGAMCLDVVGLYILTWRRPERYRRK